MPRLYLLILPNGGPLPVSGITPFDRLSETTFVPVPPTLLPADAGAIGTLNGIANALQTVKSVACHVSDLPWAGVAEALRSYGGPQRPSNTCRTEKEVLTRRILLISAALAAPVGAVQAA
jgi:hypothetical protein